MSEKTIKAISKYVRVSPYKLRPFVDVVRGYSVDRALAWLQNCEIKRVRPIIKTIFSAYSNGKNTQTDISSMQDLLIKEIRIDQGPIIKYFKPGAMGKANIQRKRLSHIQVELARKISK
ncbi:50S ribosomal protein L22 [Candidatus Babeliales bacterium]|nr:50S ribosomal protein L22 [Candidatus Babeliales bacterium]